MSEMSVRLADLQDAVPKFRSAADQVNKVNSTVNAARNGVEDIIGSVGFEGAEYLILEIADALDRAIADYEMVINAPPFDFPYPAGWPVGPDGQPIPFDKLGDIYGDLGSKPKHDHKGNKDKDGDKNGHSSHGGTMPPSSSGTNNGSEDEEQGTGQPTGTQAQPTGTGTSTQTGTGSQNTNSTNDGGAAGAAGGIIGAVMGAFGLNKKKQDGEEEEEEPKQEYVSAANAPLKRELDEKKALLEQTETRLAELEAERADKADLLGRLQAAVVANPEGNRQLEEQIEELKKRLTEIDTEMYYGSEDIPKLRKDIEALQKRLDIFQFGPDADWDAIRSYEGGETSIWIREATRNEDNSVNCVNYVVNRMPIPPELPFNAHLWDEQVTKYGSKYGITIGDVPLEGSVIVMEREHSYAHDIYGHVMYVEKVDENGVVWVTDNNYMDKPVRLDDLTSETSGPYIKYLYFPWQTKV